MKVRRRRPACPPFCPGKRICHPGLHVSEKARDATINVGITASQFHGGGYQQASASAIGTAVALDIAGKVGPQAGDRLPARVEFGVHPCQGIGNVAIERAQEQRVLVAECGVETAARELRRTKQVRQRRGVIAARPEHIHCAFDGGFDVETPGAATGRRYSDLAAHC